MIKTKLAVKVISAIVSLGVITASAMTTGDVIIEDNVLKMDVSSDTIIVGTFENDTKISEAFSSVEIDGNKIESGNMLSVLDFRYMSGTTEKKIDNKVFEMDDIVPKSNKVYVLFKPLSDGGMVGANSRLVAKTDKLTLTEYGTVSNSANNAYDVIGKLSYGKAKPVVAPTPVKEIDTGFIEQKNTGIKDNLIVVIVLMSIATMALVIPNRKQSC